MLKLAVVLALTPAPARASAIDLHVHVRMDAALPGIFRGHPTKEPAGRGRFQNQVSLADLEAANVRLIIATLYAPPALSALKGGYHKALLEQADAVEAWAGIDPRVTLVKEPEQAEAVLKSKQWRLGVILAAEGAHGVETAEKLDALWNRGLRMLTIAHFIDGPWAGAAAVRYFPKPSCRPGGKDSGKRNPKGLTKTGSTLAERAIAKGLILDLTHSSDATVMELAEKHPGLPLMFSHQAARELTPCERTLSAKLLREVKRSGGIVGLHFGSMYVGPDLDSLLAHAKLFAREAGPEAVVLGSDYNGLVRPAEGVSYASVLKELRSAGIPAHRGAERFLDFWRRTLVYRAQR